MITIPFCEAHDKNDLKTMEPLVKGLKVLDGAASVDLRKLDVMVSSSRSFWKYRGYDKLKEQFPSLNIHRGMRLTTLDGDWSTEIERLAAVEPMGPVYLDTEHAQNGTKDEPGWSTSAKSVDWSSFEGNLEALSETNHGFIWSPCVWSSNALTRQRQALTMGYAVAVLGCATVDATYGKPPELKDKDAAKHSIHLMYATQTPEYAMVHVNDKHWPMGRMKEAAWCPPSTYRILLNPSLKHWPEFCQRYVEVMV